MTSSKEHHCRQCGRWCEPDATRCAECSAPPPAPTAGIKHDSQKARWDLVPWGAMIEVVYVLTHGAEKYSPDNWRQVPEHRRRYLAAALRHVVAWATGEIHDKETGRHHLAHAVCCLMFLIAREGEG